MRNTALFTLVLASLLGGAGTAYADQCAWNDKPVVERAAAIVKQGSTVLEFCEPCGETAPGKPFTVQTVTIDATNGELVVNGKDMDLAYLFVQTGPKQFKNVGLDVSCGASDVSKSIEDGKPIGRTKRAPHHHGSGASRPVPAPPPRPTTITELAGTWSIRLDTQYSTCPNIQVGPSLTKWSVHVSPNGQITAKSDDGYELVGNGDSTNPKLLRAKLRSTKQPSALGLNLTFGWKDQFFGELVRAEPTRKSSDPVCVAFQRVSGRRQP